MAGPSWVDEAYDDVITRYLVTKVLHEGKTAFQNVQIVDTEAFGRMLLLDGIVQTTERDEFVYHEMMTHIPLLSHPCPENVLIIGGGDGGILREVLKHDSVKKAVLVEIDEQVIELSRQFLPMICGSGFDDPRSKVVIGDGAQFIADARDPFDTVIVDSPDPIGPAEVLFSKKFYEDLARVLGPSGTMSRQTGIAFGEATNLCEAQGRARSLFTICAPYLFTVPTYVCGSFSSILCSNAADLAWTSDDIRARFAAANLETKYYSPEIHHAAFQLPPFLKQKLGM